MKAVPFLLALSSLCLCAPNPDGIEDLVNGVSSTVNQAIENIGGDSNEWSSSLNNLIENLGSESQSLLEQIKGTMNKETFEVSIDFYSIC